MTFLRAEMGRTFMAKVTAADRKKSGMRGKGKKGKYPTAKISQCLSAIRLRHNGKGVSASAVLAHVAASLCAKNPRVKAALAAARAKDRKGNSK
jgi:hypothetical protein